MYAFAFLTVSHNGVLTFRPGTITSPERLTWFDRSGNVLGVLGDVDDYSNPALSPDGQRVAVSIRDSSGKRDIWVFDVTRGAKTRITLDPADETNPVWSPTGSEIAYSSDRHGHRDIYVKSASGNGPERAILESNVDKTILDWSSDGRILYSVVKATTGRELWIYPLTGSQRTPWPLFGAPYRQDQAAFSPDAHMIVYRSEENPRRGRPDLYLQLLPDKGTRWQVTTDGGGDPQWRGDGRELFYLSQDAVMAVDVAADGSPGTPRKLFSITFPPRIAGRNRFAVSKDGQRFLGITAEQAKDPATIPFVVILNWQRLLDDR